MKKEIKTVSLTPKQVKELVRFLESVYETRGADNIEGMKWFDKGDDSSYGPTALLNQLTNDNSWVLNNLGFHND
jgi:hypothetical protein